MTKALLIFPLLAAILWASPSAAEVCQNFAARADLAAALRLAAEARPVHVTFDVRAAGVSLPGWLAAQHPDDMTIVLQHEFDRLVVKDDRFEVGLWFKRRYARLVVPFAAVKGLWDNGKLKCGSA
ncbi:MAG: ClpXP protease specificity-enhancing factor SspB [Bradyrhizobium sp.]|uniref:ClpXP protease specificity-enhancing factor SspB n=1 Tax=Bradyrhizobium sp. TaxID=376 RepID=UPI003D0DFC32